MAQKSFSLRDIKGLTPAIDPTQAAEQLFVLQGKNFTLDSIGPRSNFGDRLMSTSALAKLANSQGIMVPTTTGRLSFLLTTEAIWLYNSAIRDYDLVFPLPELSPVGRWTWAYLSRRVYFAHPDLGDMIVYHVDSGQARLATQIALGLPEGISVVGETNGRIVGIDADLNTFWSAPSDGLDYRPTLGGAGFQSVEERISGAPLALGTDAGGVNIFTTNGILRGNFTTSAQVFDWKAISTEFKPMNGMCVSRASDDTQVILDTRGLFVVERNTIKALTPIFNEFLINYLREQELNLADNARLEWDFADRRVFISLRHATGTALYDKAFVLYLPLDKWGTFDERHYGIIPLARGDIEGAGFVDESGRVRYWRSAGSKVKSVVPIGADQHIASHAVPTTEVVGGDYQVVGSCHPARDYADSATWTQSGFYGVSANAPMLPALRDLDSFVSIGLLRGVDERSPQDLTEVLGLQIRSLISGPEDQVTVDYNVIETGTEDEDYESLTGQEDFGPTRLHHVTHGLRLIGSVDGLTAWQSEVPTPTGFAEGARYYACSVIGIWHLVRIGAETIGDAYHVRTVGLNATYAGRLD